jgi:hypothetical protein
MDRLFLLKEKRNGLKGGFLCFVQDVENIFSGLKIVRIARRYYRGVKRLAT